MSGGGFPNRAAWLAHRAGRIGASEVGALFGVGHTPLYTLWHVKAGNVPPPSLDDDERVFWGQVLEPAIAAGLATLNGWRLRPALYAEHPTVPGMGASPDFDILGDDGQPAALLEVKNVAFDVHRAAWGDEPPLHILLQAQAQMACTGLSLCHVGALVAGNTPRTYAVPRRPAVIAEIERRVTAFWRSIAEGRAPEPTGHDRDAETVRALHPDLDDAEADLSDDNEAPILCAEMLRQGAIRREAAEAEAEARARLLVRLADHGRAIVPGFRVSVSVTPAKPERVALAGEKIPGRAEARRLNVKEAV